MLNGTLLVAGGGIAGVAAALAAGPRHVILMEQAEDFTEVGAGLQLGPNAVRALQRIGAWDHVAPIASSPPEIHMRDGISGKILKRLRLGQQFEARFGAPYRVAHRAELLESLLQTARTRSNIELHTHARLLSVNDLGDRVTVSLEGGANHTGAALVGADGVRSTVRQSIIAESPLVDSGMILHRALFQAPGTLDGVDLDCVNLWLCPGAHVVHYPVGRQRKLNVVATAPGKLPLDAVFHGCHPALRRILSTAPEWLPWPAIYVSPLPTWCKGNVMILGDAAHATLPFLAQGAAMALEDTAALADELGRSPDTPATFRAVESRRRARATRLLQESLAAGQRYHAAGLARRVQNTALSLAPERLLWNNLAWIYEG